MTDRMLGTWLRRRTFEGVMHVLVWLGDFYVRLAFGMHMYMCATESTGGLDEMMSLAFWPPDVYMHIVWLAATHAWLDFKLPTYIPKKIYLSGTIYDLVSSGWAWP